MAEALARIGNAKAGIDLRGVSKTYGDHDAVKDLSLTIRPREFITLLGPSGSGKTTTLSMIAGFIKPSAGQIFIGDGRIDHLPPERRNIGVVFQNYALFPHMTVAENVAFPLQMRSLTKADMAAKVRAALQSVQLEQLADRFPHQLSGGQQQRVALARAIVFDPPVMLLDEPLGALDKNLREDMQVELKELHRNTLITMVYVTHDQEEALALSDRIAIMNNGIVEQIGSPEELYWSPANEFVARFIGESNFFDATIENVSQTGISARCLETSFDIEAGGSGMRAGQKVGLMLRPEHMEITKAEGKAGQEIKNSLKGVVIEKLFLGGRIKTRISLRNGVEISASSGSTGKLGTPYNIGDDVAIQWKAENMQVFPR